MCYRKDYGPPQERVLNDVQVMTNERRSDRNPVSSKLKAVSSPVCVGIIMDGNRRWARERGLPTLEGHRRGYQKLKEVAQWSRTAGVRHLAFYALSTENWKRAEEEVAYLMDLFRMVLSTELSTLRAENTAVHLVGDVERFPQDLQESIRDMHASNPIDAEHHVWLCASYGGRAEIVAAVNSLCAKSVDGVIDETVFSHALWTLGMPDPDIIIRTGGEHRLSGFLTWQSVYSELFFLDPYWPDFSKEMFDQVLADFASRERRHGT